MTKFDLVLLTRAEKLNNMKHEILSETSFVTGTCVSDVSVLLLLLLNIPSLKTSIRQKDLHNIAHNTFIN